MKILNILTVVFLLFSIPAKAESVGDPIDDYLSKYGSWLLDSNSKEIIIFESDFNGDGQNEIFITNDIRTNGKAGYDWSIYISYRGGYIETPIGDSPAFFYEGVYLGLIDEVGKTGLLTYFPGSANDGSLIAYTISKVKLDKHNLGYIFPAGKDKSLFEKYFNKKVIGVNVRRKNFIDTMKTYGKPIVLKRPKKMNCGKEEIEMGICSN